jgi:glutamyl-tRNA synthetase
MNAKYIAALPMDELMPHLEPFLAEVGLDGVEDRARLEWAVELHRVRAGTLKELAGQLTPYFAERLDYDAGLCAKFLADAELPTRLEKLRDRYAAVEPFAVEPLEEQLRSLADELGVKAGALIHPLRMALSGTPKGPGVFDLVALQGRESALRHLDAFLAWLRRESAAPDVSGA